MRMLCLFAALLAAAPAATAPSRLLVARGAWAAFDRGGVCEAVARPFTARGKAGDPPFAAIAFDRGGPRHGQLYLRLQRPARVGSTVVLRLGTGSFLLDARGRAAWSRGPAQEAALIAALRIAGGMRVEARDVAGRRMIDRYASAGAPAAIDAAAAACSRQR